MPPPPGSVEVRRGADRPHTHQDGIDSRHSFSFGAHYDPDNTGFGLLVAHHEDTVGPGCGYDAHRHRDTEIVTWVLEGRLAHEDADGHRSVVGPGQVQRLSAGHGTTHAERQHPDRDGPGAPVRFVQAWLLPDPLDAEPSYDRADVAAALASGGLVEVASGAPTYAGPGVRLRQRHAALHVGRLGPGTTVTLPAAPYRHLYLARGSVALGPATPEPEASTVTLHAGDAARLTGDATRTVTAVTDAEVLVWAMHLAARDLRLA